MARQHVTPMVEEVAEVEEAEEASEKIRELIKETSSKQLQKLTEFAFKS